MQIANNSLNGLQTSDIITIITTLAIVAANSFVTLYIYFHSRRPNFAVDRFEESTVWKIGIHDVDKPISRCVITFDGRNLTWDGSHWSHEKYIPAGGAGNVTIRDPMTNMEDVPIRVKSGSRTVRKYRFGDIPIR